MYVQVEIGEEPEECEGSDHVKHRDDGVGVPHILLDCADQEKPPAARVLEAGCLPSVADVLDGLGLGPKGPPIPPPATFAVVPYAVKRHAPAAEGAHYIFVASSPDDP